MGDICAYCGDEIVLRQCGCDRERRLQKPKWEKHPPIEEGLYWWRPNKKEKATVWEIYSTVSGPYMRGACKGFAGAFSLSKMGGEWVHEPLHRPQ